MTDAYRDEKRRVAQRMAVALVLTAAVLGGAALTARGSPSVPFAERMQGALRTDMVVVLWLATAIGNVARLRLFSPDDIAGSSSGTGSAQVRQGVAILQNTLEQVVLAVPTHLIVAATFDRSPPIVLALACLFCAGRALFWTGYGRGAHGRALGFALTFYPSVLALLAAGIAVATGRAA